jgi:hypothetical protein
MAKKNKSFVPLNQMSRKDKIIHFFKIFGISFAAVIGLFAGITLYVWATGGFNPPYEPLTAWAFSQSEYVIDGNKDIDIDSDGNQKYDNGNLLFVQKTNNNGDALYESIMIVPNEGCTELDAEIKISFSSNPNMPVVQLVEDENTKALDATENDSEEKLHFKYSVKIGSPIYIKPVTTKINDRDTNLGGWAMLTATQGLMQTSCWVFVDVPVEKLTLSLDNSESFEASAENDEIADEVYYNVFTNSSLHISNTITPNSANKLPKSNVPTSKVYNGIAGATGFLNEKKVIYEVSDNQIAQIDNYGNITISKGKEGETFYITAYTISKYNNLDKVPTIQEFEDDENRDPSQSAQELYKKAFNKIAVTSNKVFFKIKPIEVESITTGSKNWATPTYNVFEPGVLKFSNTITNVTKNNYFVDLVLSDSVDESYKNDLINKIKVLVVYESESADNSSENINNEQVISKIKINGNSVKTAAKYFALNYIKGEWQYIVKQYAANNFYFVFYYELDDEIIYDYVLFNINKVAVNELEVDETAINLTLKDDKVSMSLNNFAKSYPNNATYKDIKYFVPATDDLIDCKDASLKILINGVEYKVVSTEQVEGPNAYNYNTLVATSTGKTTMIAVVLRTIPTFNEETNEIVYDEQTGEIVYNYIISSDYAEWEYFSEAVTINVTKDVEITDIKVDDEEPVAAENCDVFKEIYQGEKITISLYYQGLPEYLENDKLKISLIEGGNTTVAIITNIDNTTVAPNGDRIYKFDIISNNVGIAKYQVIYNSSEGEKSIYTIGVRVLPIDLVGIKLTAESSEINLSYQVQGNIITGYSWNDLQLQIELNSPKSLASYEIRTYQVVDEYVSLLENYVGKDYLEEINNLDESINTIQKLISKLHLSNEIIQIVDNTDEADAEIIVGDEHFAYAFNKNYKFNSSFTANLLIVVESLDGICSNPLLVTVKIPEIVVQYGDNDQKSQTIYSQGRLTTYDGETTTDPKSVDIYSGANGGIKFLTHVNGVEYDLGLSVNLGNDQNNNLIKFSFTNNQQTSQDSGAVIDGYKITFADVSSIATDVIIAQTDFGFIKEDFYTYYINPDYNVINNISDNIYTTPDIVYLFDNFEGEGIYITNAEFDINSDNLEYNKLFLPYGYEDLVINYIENASEEDLAKFFNKFYYSDPKSSEPYYHIYCNLVILQSSSLNDEDYRMQRDENGVPQIVLFYKEEKSTIHVYMETEGGYQINQIKLTLKPGLSSEFDPNNIIPASGITNTEIDLLERLNFKDENNNLLDSTSDFAVDIKNINFAITNKTNSNIWFYQTSNGERIEGYTQFEEISNYKTESEFEALSSDEKLEYKKYYILTSDYNLDISKTYYKKDVYELVDTPNNNNINEYYEEVHEYKLTEDKQIVSGRTYYKQIVEGDNISYVVVSTPAISEIGSYYVFDYKHFVLTNDGSVVEGKDYYIRYLFKEVEDDELNIDELDSYYEVVYSKETYYDFVEAYYKEVPQEEVNISYLSRYFVRDVNGNYESANSFKDGQTYYYRYTYKQIEENGDISNAYFKYTIELKIQKDENGNVISCRLIVSPEIIDIEYSVNLKFSIKVQITNKNIQQSNNSVNYNGFYYDLVFEGFNG